MNRIFSRAEFLDRFEHEPLEPWREVSENPDWTTYYVETDAISVDQIVELARKHLAKQWGDLVYDKDIEVKYIYQSQKSVDEELDRIAKWKAEGCPKFKVQFAESGKESFKKVLGEEGAQELFDATERRNAEISEEQNRKKLEDDSNA